MKFAFLFLIVLLAVPELSVVRAQTARYSCPMHPEVVSTRRGKCPKCGMTLVKQTTKPKPKTEPESAPATTADSFSSTKIPDAPVLDQNGKQLHFYSDLI